MRVYLDCNATTPPDPRVLAEMAPYSTGRFGNPSSLHAFGREARAAVERARARVAGALGAGADEIVFTSGGTEANALAIRGAALARRGEGRRLLAGATEHPSVLETLEGLRTEGFETALIPVDREGVVHPPAVEEALRPGTLLVSVMAVNNETGTMQPLREIGALLRRHGVLFHVDAAQALARIPLAVAEIGCDLLTLSAHKAHGPMGAGALFVRRGTALAPLLCGGGQERGRRSGTENLPAIVGLGRAAELARLELPGRAACVEALSRSLLEGARALEPRLRRNGGGAPAVPHTLNLHFPRVRGETLMVGLDLEGVAVSVGSACASGSPGPSHVLLAMGRTREEALASIRIGVSHANTAPEIGFALDALGRVLRTSRGVR